MSDELPPEVVAAIRRVNRYTDLLLDVGEQLAAANADLEALLPAEPEKPGRGRPRVLPTHEEQVEILRLWKTGRIGKREIGRRLDLSRHAVARTIEEDAAAQNSSKAAQKSSQGDM